MKSAEVNLCNLGPRLTLTFVILVALILGGNGLVIWQFQIARQQTARLTAVSRELIAVQRLQETLLIFHQRLDEIAHTKDARRLVTEAEPSLRALLEQADETRNTLTHLPAEIFVDPLEAIKVTLPSQLEGITALAKSGDWEAVDLRLANELKPMETQTSILVNSIERQVRGEMAQAVANMGGLQRRILLIVPTTATFTFFVAAFFGWSIARRIIELSVDERAKERSRIAGELHDGVLQQITSLSLLLGSVKRQPDSEAKAAKISELQKKLMQVGTDIRRLSHELHPAVLQDGGLSAALSGYCEEFSKARDIRVSCETDDSVKELSAEVALCFYRIAQEALGNVAKHSAAKTVQVRLARTDGGICLCVSDDGVGFAADRAADSGGLGLINMRERARQLQGTLEFETQPGRGTTVRAVVPFRPSQ
jgi:signal transduction histidine kinase